MSTPDVIVWISIALNFGAAATYGVCAARMRERHRQALKKREDFAQSLMPAVAFCAFMSELDAAPEPIRDMARQAIPAAVKVERIDMPIAPHPGVVH